MRYHLSDIAEITGTIHLGADALVDRVLTDSRGVVRRNDLFAAINGKNHDGHDFLGELYEAGVRAFIVEKIPDRIAYKEAGFIVTDDTLNTLQKLAAFHRSHFQGTTVAITGSNGKTVVKEWIAQLCPENLRMYRSPKSYNSQLGVALSLLAMEGTEDFSVIEAGISLPGEMEKLEPMIRPEIGVLINIGAPHQENFRDVEHKLREKLILFKNCRKIVFHSGCQWMEKIIEEVVPEAEKLTVGWGGSLVEILEENGLYREVGIRHGNQQFRFPLQFADRIFSDNAMLALGVYLAMGTDPKTVIPLLSRLRPVEMRMELKEGIGGGLIVNDSYNADLHSLSISLDYLSSIAAGREKTVILSDLYQTGIEEEELYSRIDELLRQNDVKHFVGIGSHTARFFPGRGKIFTDADDFLRRADLSDFYGQAVLVKGSRTFRLEKITATLEKQLHSTTLEVDLDAMIHNLNFYRSRLRSGTRVMAMVKALSYGSGTSEIAAVLQREGVDYLAVAFADEGVTLRNSGIRLPIVVLNADYLSFGTMIDHRLEPEIYSFHSLQQFVKELNYRGEQSYPIHISIDTGMHRLGFRERDIDRLIHQLGSSGAVKVHSVFTHFAASDESVHDDFTRKQVRKFNRTMEKFKESFPDAPILFHASNSAAIERFPETHFDMVRLGIGLYGISTFHKNELKPVSTLKSRIVQIKTLEAGETVGYGRRGTVTAPSTIATLPIGYADGLDRRLGRGNWSFRVKNRYAPTIGNICMDTCMIDITGIEAEEGEEAVIFGADPSIYEMARTLETIPYEILTSVSPRVKRVYYKE